MCALQYLVPTGTSCGQLGQAHRRMGMGVTFLAVYCACHACLLNGGCHVLLGAGLLVGTVGDDSGGTGGVGGGLLRHQGGGEEWDQ